MRLILMLIASMCLLGNLSAQVMIIPGVPDLQQPIDPWWGNLPDNAITRAIRKNFHAERSGDIYLVFEPNVFINDFDGLTVASTHGSPWRYDTHVPVIFAGAGLESRMVSRPVTPYDIAPTLSALLGIREPAASIGVPLPEVLDY